MLFDSGLHPQTQTDPAGRLGGVVERVRRRVRGRARRSRRGSPRSASTRRASATSINSHLHFDHTGGNAQIPNARLVVQRREWEAGHDADQIARQFYIPHDYEHGHDMLLVDGEHDLFGDGRVVCLPTYGHTPGHQSLRVRLDCGDVVLTGDACYLRRTLEELHLPSVVDDAEAMRALAAQACARCATPGRG